MNVNIFAHGIYLRYDPFEFGWRVQKRVNIAFKDWSWLVWIGKLD